MAAIDKLSVQMKDFTTGLNHGADMHSHIKDVTDPVVLENFLEDYGLVQQRQAQNSGVWGEPEDFEPPFVGRPNAEGRHLDSPHDNKSYDKGYTLASRM